MTLKEELEILRGEPIKVFEGDPMDIPCIETSDPEKLCKHPVVSVNMITYNHEPYIRQAIEGVLMQKTDFEFELVIGEDCSQDKTREICFEYQKKYPDKIRVLWWHENVSKLGGNGRRVRAHCRGEFIALCEGDDYWIDPLKLQKQVDYIRETNAVMCVANSEWHYADGSVRTHIFDRQKRIVSIEEVVDYYFHTTTYLMRRTVFLQCVQRYPEIIFWYDTVVQCLMATMGPLCFIPDVVSVYRWTGQGISGSSCCKKRDLLMLTQQLQFSWIGNASVAQPCTTKYIDTLENMFGAVDENYKFRHSLGDRLRYLRLLWRIYRRQGKLKHFYEVIVTICLKTITGICIGPYDRMPLVQKWWRRFKTIGHR